MMRIDKYRNYIHKRGEKWILEPSTWYESPFIKSKMDVK